MSEGLWSRVVEIPLWRSVASWSEGESVTVRDGGLHGGCCSQAWEHEICGSRLGMGIHLVLLAFHLEGVTKELYVHF